MDAPESRAWRKVGDRRRPGRLGRRWMAFWVRFGGTGVLGRLASRLASWPAPPHLDHVSLAYLTPRGYIDATATVHHAALYFGDNVYVAPGAAIIQGEDGGAIRLGDRVAIHKGTLLETGQGGSIELAQDASVHPGCQLKAYRTPILVGEGVMIAANAAIYSYDHGLAPGQPIRRQPLIAKGAVTIGAEAWVGTGAVILSGVTVGEGAVIAAGAVVTKSIPPGAIAAGNPARVIKYRHELESAGDTDEQQ